MKQNKVLKIIFFKWKYNIPNLNTHQIVHYCILYNRLNTGINISNGNFDSIDESIKEMILENLKSNKNFDEIYEKSFLTETEYELMLGNISDKWSTDLLQLNFPAYANKKLTTKLYYPDLGNINYQHISASMPPPLEFKPLPECKMLLSDIFKSIEELS